MGKFLKALRIAEDCAEIIVAGSILVEQYEKFKGRKKVKAKRYSIDSTNFK